MKITIQIIILLVSFGLVDCYNRYFVVDEVHGRDYKTCLEDINEFCRSIAYIFKNIVNSTKLSEIDIKILGTYHLNETFFVEKAKRVTFSSFNRSRANIVAGHSNASFVLGSQVVLNSFEIMFSELNFMNFSENNTAVITGWSVSLNVVNCTFINNNCSAINILDSATVIVGSVFINNYGNAVQKKIPSLNNDNPSFPYGQNSAGGAVSIIFSNQNNISVMIKNNKFLNNHALAVKSNLVTEIRNSSLLLSHIGGGLLVAFMNKTMNNYVIIRDNNFDSNKASIGGALMLSFHDHAILNSVVIIHNKILRNEATSTGGGFAIATWGGSDDNVISFESNYISENRALVGGGGKILLQSIIESHHTHNRKYFPSKQIINFKNTTFTNNKASSAAGLHMIYNVAIATKPLHPVKFTNVTFSSHMTNLHHDINSSPSAYSGIFLSNRLDIQFEGHSSFFNNNVESSIYLCNSDLFLHGYLHIHDNTVQTSGGGMALTDVSHIHLFSGSTLLFEHNFAQVQGGALFVRSIGFPDMVYMFNPSCFIQYGQYNELPPSKWNASIHFIGNGAGLKGSAIYTNTITSCTWSEESPHYDISKALRWEGAFLYKGNYIRGESVVNSSLDIATDVVEYNLKMDEQIKEVAPGQNLMFHIDAYDELKNPVYSVPVAYIDSSESLVNNTIELDQKYYIIHGHDADNMSLKYSATPEYYNQLDTGLALQQTIHFMDSTSNFPSNANITIKTVKCYPGFVYKDGYCKCDLKNKDIVRCDDELVYIKENRWAMVGANDQLIVKNCPNLYCQCNSNETKLGCAFNFKNPNLQCEKNRVGTLCGKCVNGTGLDFMTSQCVTCKHFPWSIVALALMGSAMLLVSGLIIILNPQFSSYLKGILFYLQILPYVCSMRGDINKYVHDIASWVDLGGFNNVPISSCFLQHFSSLHITSLGYLYPAVILLLLLIIYILHKAHLMNLQRNSPFQSFWILVVIMYKFLVETSLLILSCVDIEGKQVFFYDGSISCYKDTHLILTGVAVGVLGLLVVPPPILVPLFVSGVLPAGPFFADALAQGLRKHVRWWWSIDFLRRIAFIAIYVFIVNYKIKQTSLMACSIFTLVLHAQMQPYRNRMANAGETFLLLSLTLITALPQGEEEYSVMKYIVAGIIIATFIYIIVVVLYLSIMFLIKRCRNQNYVEYKEESEDMYDETLSRRLKYNPQPLNSPKVRQESPILNGIMANQSVPVPHYTRSDYIDNEES